MKLIKTTLTTTLLTLLLSSSVLADCSYELFSISSTKDTKIIDFVEQLSSECEFSIIVTDPHANEFLNTKLNRTNLNNLTIDEVFDIILKENNLQYTLENNILRISYLNTRMFGIDYILSQRKGTSNTDVTLSSGNSKLSSSGTGSSGTGSSGTGSSGTKGANSSGSTNKSGMKIESSDEVIFWHELDLELQRVLNRPEDVYKAEAPIINKNAGIITVTATIKQINRLEKYLKNLQEKIKLQVLIDVQLLSVTMSEGQTTGVDWQQLFALQNIDLKFDKLVYKGVSEFTDGKITTGISAHSDTVNNNLLTIHSAGTLKEVIKFLKTQGDVSSISNPKVLTLNNQPALITAGTEYFYKITQTETLAGSGTGSQSTGEQIKSVFAGVLLDITPEISDNNTITLKINPSLSETVSNSFAIEDGTERTMPPDLVRRQLSSVVTVKNGHRIILGGLINSSTSVDESKVPLLGDIPILGYLFSHKKNVKTITELIMIITPHIIKPDQNNISLSDLGYESLNDDIMNYESKATKKLKKKEEDGV
ncbi:MAG: pilus (MSHA type) biogenesis protein MshL [Sulfurimonas sp.]|nr:pilus (MSHA type) biogenesis protein MshL [Sulfurimonas sp.]